MTRNKKFVYGEDFYLILIFFKKIIFDGLCKITNISGGYGKSKGIPPQCRQKVWALEVERRAPQHI